jgi:hypothetical protein
MRCHALTRACLLLASCTCGVPGEPDAAFDAGRDGGSWGSTDAEPIYQDTGVYQPRDAGPPAFEPCRGATRRVRFPDLPFGHVSRLVGFGDRLAVHHREVEPATSRLSIVDIETGALVAVTDPVPHLMFSDVAVAHADGFDLVAWTEDRAAIARFNRDGAAIGTALYERTAGSAYPISNLIRTEAGHLVVLGSPSGMMLEVLGDDGLIRDIPLGFADGGETAIAAIGDWVVGAIAFADEARGPTRFVRFDVDLSSAAVHVTEMGTGGQGASVGAYADVTSALAVFALRAEVGQPSGLRLVWWTPGGAEIARRDLEGLSLQPMGLAGIAGASPAQTLAYYASPQSSLGLQGYLFAARVRAPDVIEGGTSPLVSGVIISHASTWEWTEGGIAMGYAGAGRLEVLLTCEGTP